MAERLAPLLLALALAACEDDKPDVVRAAAPASAPAVAALAPAEQDALVKQAIVLLDGFAGQTDDLAKAAQALDRVLAANPTHVQAHIEKARYYLNASNIREDDSDPEFFAHADLELQQALANDPNSANAYVLLGILRINQQVPQEAIKVLEKAEAIGTDNPWLDLNFATAYTRLKQWDQASARLKRLEAKLATQTEPPHRIAVAVVDGWKQIHESQGDAKALTADYEKLATMDPGSAWAHGNYAMRLLMFAGQTDAAIDQAEQALKLMDYGMARYMLSMAQYAKWAALQKTDAGRAKTLYDQAQATLSNLDEVMSQAGGSLEFNPDLKALVVALLAKGVSIDAKNSEGDTALSRAAYAGNLQSMKWLLSKSAKVDVQDAHGRAPIALATTQGHADIVGLLAANGADVNASDQYADTPLYLAVAHGDISIARQLIALKADVNKAAAAGDTPLMVAAGIGDQALVELLVSAGADPTLRMSNRQDAADIAETNQHHELALWLRAKATAPSAKH